MGMREVAERFSRHDFGAAAGHLAEDVRWELVGQRDVVGRAAVLALCEESAEYLAGVTTTFTAFRTIVGDGVAVTDSVAEYAGADESSRVASCDLYTFDGDRLTAIRSFTVELPPQE